MRRYKQRAHGTEKYFGGRAFSACTSTACSCLSSLTFDKARSDGSGQYNEDATVLVSEGSDLGCAIAAVIYKTRELFSRSRRVTMDYQAEEAPLYGNSKFHPEWYENWYDGIGYCESNPGFRLTDILTLHRHMECSRPRSHRAEDRRSLGLS